MVIFNGFIFFKWVVSAPGIQVTFPPKSDVSTDFAWILRLDNLLN